MHSLETQPTMVRVLPVLEQVLLVFMQQVQRI